MEPVQAIILGVIQGLTEFLPVSSSGRLVLTRHLFGLIEPALFFDTSVHVGTMLAVMVVFKAELINIFRSLVATGLALWRQQPSPTAQRDAYGLKLALLVVVGSIPTAIIGLVIQKTLSDWLASLYLVGAMLIITATILLFTKGRGKTGDDILQFSRSKALVVGCVQGLAVLPGISRSGATIAVGLFLGLDRKTAARYSFLLSIPAVAGAELLAIKDLVGDSASLDGAVLLGAITAFVVGYLALKTLLVLVERGSFYLFAPYCLALGLTALGVAWF